MVTWILIFGAFLEDLSSVSVPSWVSGLDVYEKSRVVCTLAVIKFCCFLQQFKVHYCISRKNASKHKVTETLPILV